MRRLLLCALLGGALFAAFPLSAGAAVYRASISGSQEVSWKVDGTSGNCEIRRGKGEGKVSFRFASNKPAPVTAGKSGRRAGLRREHPLDREGHDRGRVHRFARDAVRGLRARTGRDRSGRRLRRDEVRAARGPDGEGRVRLRDGSAGAARAGVDRAELGRVPVPRGRVVPRLDRLRGVRRRQAAVEAQLGGRGVGRTRAAREQVAPDARAAAEAQAHAGVPQARERSIARCHLGTPAACGSPGR